LADNKPKFVGNVIKYPGAIIRFVRVYKAEARSNRGKPKMRMNKKTNQEELDLRFSLTALLDPTNKVHAEKIEETKAEAVRAMNHLFGSQENWPKRNEATGLGAPIFCFGLANKLPKVYDGFKDMWYIKLSTPDYNRPLIWTRRHTPVVQESDDQAPYDGSVCNVSADLWPYSNESSGVNGNLRELQFVQDGKEYTSGGRSGDDFAALGDEPAYAGSAAKDPFDE
jgi:Protein of unknown function (DUF2815)